MVYLRRTFNDRIYNFFEFRAAKFYFTFFVFNFRGPASKIIVKFCIAVSCGILGAIFTFPGLRMARMHWDSLKYCRESKMLQLILNTSFVLPFLIVILWIKPISREYLTNRAFAGMDHPLYENRDNFDDLSHFFPFYIRLLESRIIQMNLITEFLLFFSCQANTTSIRFDTLLINYNCCYFTLGIDANLFASIP